MRSLSAASLALWLLAAFCCDSATAQDTPAPSPSATMASPTVSPTQFTEPASGCYTDLNKVANRVATKPAFKVETFTLCPDTVYKIGYLGSGGLTEDGFPALQLRQNTHYRCGEDGKSTNNCIIAGGQFQIISTFNSFNEEPKVNVRLDGITFIDGDTAGALLVAPGDVIFTDCIFRVGHFVAGSVL